MPLITMPIRRIAGCVVLFSVSLSCAPVIAVDVPARNPPAEDRAMVESRAAVKDRAWERAVGLLTLYLRAYPDDADGHNLLGYSLRHLGRYAESQTAYDKALSLDPGHLGALEYRGELMLILGRRDQAVEHLQTLERLCGVQCEEYLELRQAIDRGAAPSR